MKIKENHVEMNDESRKGLKSRLLGRSRARGTLVALKNISASARHSLSFSSFHTQSKTSSTRFRFYLVPRFCLIFSPAQNFYLRSLVGWIKKPSVYYSVSISNGIHFSSLYSLRDARNVWMREYQADVWMRILVFVMYAWKFSINSGLVEKKI